MTQILPVPPGPLRPRDRTAWLRVALSVAACCVPLPALAQPDLPVQISADSAQMDERRGVGIYSGNVVVTRGAMTLHADRITIHTPERRPTRMEAEGTPVRVETPDEAGQPRIATARRMEYGFDNELLVLLDDARVRTATEDARGDRITYDLAQEIIQIEGSPERRVEITIQPRSE